jgi:hypothetical protein
LANVVFDCSIVLLIFLSSRDSLRMSSLGKPMKLVEPGRWRDMSTDNARKILGRRAVDEDVIMAVLTGLGMWGGLEVGQDGSVTLNSKEFRAWIGCLCNKSVGRGGMQFHQDKIEGQLPAGGEEGPVRIAAGVERMSSFGKPLKLVGPGKWRDMNTENVRKVRGRRAVDEDVIMAVLTGLGMWGGLEVGQDGSVTLNSKEFRAWVGSLCNRVLDEEACGFIKSRLKVDVQPQVRRTRL